jgi:DNA-binding MarR family transcriptional regulator
MKKSNFNTHQEDLDYIIILALHKLSHVFRGLLWRHTKSIGISPIQIQILIYIEQHRQNENRITNLARNFNLTAATVSDAVKSLEKKKLLRRTVSKTDRRKFLLSLTKSGKMLTERISNWQEPMLQQLSAFTHDTRRTVSTFLIQYIESLGNAKVLSDARTCYSCFYFEKIGNQELQIKHFCVFRQMPMKDFDLRLDCPNYESKYE